MLKRNFRNRSPTLDNFKDKIERYIESKNLAGLEKKIFELFLYLNPKKENSKLNLIEL